VSNLSKSYGNANINYHFSLSSLTCFIWQRITQGKPAKAIYAVCLSLCLSVSLSVCLFVCLSLYLSVSLSVCLPSSLTCFIWQRITQGKPAKAIYAVNIRVLRLMVLLCFFALDFGYWIYDKMYKCDRGQSDRYCRTKVNYTAHFFGLIAGTSHLSVLYLTMLFMSMFLLLLFKLLWLNLLLLASLMYKCDRSILQD